MITPHASPFLVVSILLLPMLLLTSATGCETASAEEDPTRLRVYFGTYTRGDSKGIYVSELDLATGELTEPKLAGETVNPSFLAIHPSKKHLYAVGEIADFEGKKAGAVSAFAINADGTLTLLNQQPSGGGGPCHLVTDKAGKNVLVANYGGGSVASLPIGEDGKLAEPVSVIQHEGSSVNEQRQKAPHAHSINLDAANRHAVAADLGIDKLLVYDFDPKTGKLSPNDPPFATVKPGAGPRHFAFHPSGKFAYVINEMHLTVTGFKYDAVTGAFTPIQTISTIPDADRGQGGLSTAEVQVHPSGKFLYGSNRGHDTLAVFTIDPDTGLLTARGNVSTGGKTPRNFDIDPTGQYVLAANQNTHNVIVLRVNPETGDLTPTGHEVKVPSPVCVKFVVVE